MSSAPSRSSRTPLDAAVDRAVAVVAEDVAALSGARAVVLVDGRSGAGKTTFVRRLVAAWPGGGPVQSVALDSLYPGWDGLDGGVARALEDVLRPHARQTAGTWQRWDWGTATTAEAHEVDPALPLVVEGAGILTADTEPLGHVRVWIDAEPDVRRTRALARDGDAYRPHWERWAAQEEVHLVRDRPMERATRVFLLP